MIIPVVLAFLAGNVATLNPCGFAMLPAFLSFYLGAADEPDRIRGGRLGEGLLVGALVTAGFVGVFALLAIPLALGATALTSIFPWAGVAVGLVLVAVGARELAGHHLFLLLPGAAQSRRGRSPQEVVLFGAGYAVASLGCTLPTFLALTGSSLAARGPMGSAVVLLSYAAGTATILGGLSIGAAFVRDGFYRKLTRLLPLVGRVSAILLIAVGVYLTTYFVTALTAGASLTGNPVFAFVIHLTGSLQEALTTTIGRWLALLTALGIGIAAASVAWRWLRRSAIDQMPIQGRRKAL